MVRQGHFKGVVGAFLMGCAFVLVVGCSGGRSEAPKEQGHTEVTKEQAHTEATEEQVHAETTREKRSQTGGAEEEQGRSRGTAPEEVRCGGTRTIDIIGRPFITNDVPGCPNGGLLSGTEKDDKLAGEDGEDKLRGLGASDELFGGYGRDVIYGGPGEDVLYGGEGDDFIRASGDGQQDKLYYGEGRDQYAADKIDWVSSSCEEKVTLVRVE